MRVLSCLQAALNQNAGVQRQAEGVLQSFEQRPGFCSCLAVGRPVRQGQQAQILQRCDHLLAQRKPHRHKCCGTLIIQQGRRGCDLLARGPRAPRAWGWEQSGCAGSSCV